MKLTEIHVFKSLDSLTDLGMRWLIKKTNEKDSVSVALSGGTTPLVLFDRLRYKDWSKVQLDRLKLFWVDERCVDPNHPESNFGNAFKTLFEHIPIPEKNLFRIEGENDPIAESERYASILGKELPMKEGFPQFDLILLGLGNDGHTASIFPGNERLFECEQWCVATEHPLTGQKRITLTGSLINRAKGIAFMVTGASKSCLIAEMAVPHRWNRYPADHVDPHHGYRKWLLDQEAGSLILRHL